MRACGESKSTEETERKVEKMLKGKIDEEKKAKRSLKTLKLVRSSFVDEGWKMNSNLS